MKALSIIGIVLSLIGIMYSFSIMSIVCFCVQKNGAWLPNYPENAKPLGTIMLIISLFFLSFSIVATAASFKKKTTTNS